MRMLARRLDFGPHHVRPHTSMHVKVTNMLLAAGADMNTMSSKGYSALHIATHRGYDDAVKVLLDAGADQAKADGKGKARSSLVRRQTFYIYIS